MQITLIKAQVEMIFRALDMYEGMSRWKGILKTSQQRTIDIIRDKLRENK